MAADDEKKCHSESEEALVLWKGFEGDAILRVGKKKVAVNKAYLEIFSPYFKALFNSDFRESRTGEYVIGEVNEEEFIEMLRVVLPTRNPVKVSNVESLLVLADRFLIDSLKQECINFLSSPASKKLSDVDLLILAFKSGSDEVKKQCSARLTSQETINFLRDDDRFDEVSLEARGWLFNQMEDLPRNEPALDGLNIRPIVYLDVKIDGRPAGRIVLVLFSDIAPQLSEAFRSIAASACRTRDGKAFVGMGGSVHNTYDWEICSTTVRFVQDSRMRENSEYPCALTMGTSKGHSKFYLTKGASDRLPGNQVVFGHVVEGMKLVMDSPCHPRFSRRAYASVVITGYGQLE